MPFNELAAPSIDFADHSMKLLDFMLILATAITASVLYRRFRGEGHPAQTYVQLQSREDANAQAIAQVRRLTGEDATTWRAFAAIGRDDEGADALFSAATPLATCEALQRKWGVLGQWWVRFFPPDEPGSVLVAVDHDGHLTLFNDERNQPFATQGKALTGPSDALDGPHTLTGTVAETPTAQSAVEHFTEEVETVTVHVWISRADHQVTRVDRSLAVADEHAADHQKSLVWQDLAGGSAVLVSVTAMIIGILVLVIGQASPDVRLSLWLALTVTICALLSDLMSTESMVAQAYRGSAGLLQFRLVGLVMSITLALVYGIVVFVAAAAGSAITAPDSTMPTGALSAIVVGVTSGTIWLAFSAGYFALLTRLTRCRVGGNASATTVRAEPHAGFSAASSSVVAAITEEVVFRLLGISLIMAVLERWVPTSVSAIFASMATAALWAFTHSSQVSVPARYRLLELFVVGCALGVLFLTHGLVAVIVAHVLYNMTVSLSHDEPSAQPHPTKAGHRGMVGS